MKTILKILNSLVILGSVAIIVVLSIELLSPTVIIDHLDVLNFQLVVCAVFMSDFFARLVVAPDKRRYFWRHWVFFMVSIPYLNILYYTMGSVNVESYLMLRMIPLIRGAYGIAIVISFLTRSRLTSLFLTYIVTILLTSYFSSLVFYALEKGVNPEVKLFSDALWWAFMDVTTVGSNIYAVTDIGKIMSVVLAGAGMMMFPIFTAYITTKFQNLVAKKGTTIIPRVDAK